MKLIYHDVMYCQGYYEGSFGSHVFLEMGRKEPGAQHPRFAQEEAGHTFTLRRHRVNNRRGAPLGLSMIRVARGVSLTFGDAVSGSGSHAARVTAAAWGNDCS